MAPLAFEGDSVAADGHDGVVHVVVSLQRGVDVHHLEVHWDTAEPAKRHQEPSVTLVSSTSRQGFFFFFFGHSVQPENLSDVIEQLRTDPIARYERHSVSASILCGRRLQHEIVQRIP